MFIDILCGEGILKRDRGFRIFKARYEQSLDVRTRDCTLNY